MFYTAPAGKSTLWITSLVTISLLGVSIVFFSTNESYNGPASAVLILLPLLLLGGAFIFRVTGYVLTEHFLLIRRIISNFKVEVKDIESVEYEPHGMKYSIRTFGNGGLFGFYGRFYNRKYGSFRAFVTDRTNVIVLRLKDKRVLMISPEHPQQFVDKLNRLIEKF